MSGAQGAQPKGSFTDTMYESVPGGANKTHQTMDSTEDVGGIQVESHADKTKDAAGAGGPAFGRGPGQDEQKKQDIGVTGTGPA